MKILIVDDEPLARTRLRGLLSELNLGEVVGEAGNGANALRAVESLDPDLLLLDIRLPGMDGIEVAKHLSTFLNPPAVIFTTAYDAHALAAIEANAVDYLLKPIRRSRLAAALERAQRLSRVQLVGLEHVVPQGSDQRVRTHISATLQGSLQLVPVAAIRYFRAEHKYVTARHGDGQLIIDDTLSALEAEFGNRFMRAHRNALISVAHVRTLEKDRDGKQFVTFEGLDDRIEVSRRLAAEVRRHLRSP